MRVCAKTRSTRSPVRPCEGRTRQWPVISGNCAFRGSVEDRLTRRSTRSQTRSTRSYVRVYSPEAKGKVPWPTWCPHTDACVRAGVRKKRVCAKTRSTRSTRSHSLGGHPKLPAKSGDFGPRPNAASWRPTRSQPGLTRSYVRVYTWGIGAHARERRSIASRVKGGNVESRSSDEFRTGFAGMTTLRPLTTKATKRHEGNAPT